MTPEALSANVAATAANIVIRRGSATDRANAIIDCASVQSLWRLCRRSAGFHCSMQSVPARHSLCHQRQANAKRHITGKQGCHCDHVAAHQNITLFSFVTAPLRRFFGLFSSRHASFPAAYNIVSFIICLDCHQTLPYPKGIPHQRHEQCHQQQPQYDL